MTNLVNVSVENFNEVVNYFKSTKEVRNMWNAEYKTLNKLLRTIQSKTGRKIARPVLEKFGITEHINADDMCAKFFRCWVEDKKGNKFPAYVSRKMRKDKDGNAILDKEGNKTYDITLTAVREGRWSFEALIKCLASEPAK